MNTSSTRPPTAVPLIPRAVFVMGILLIPFLTVLSSAAEKQVRQRVARDFHEVVIEGFEPPIQGDHVIDDRRVSLEDDGLKATRGKGYLKIDLTPPDPLVVSFALPPEDLVGHDWLEYDLTGAAPGGVLIETLLQVEGREPLGRAVAVVEDATWVGQLLLTDFVRKPGEQPLRVEFRLTALGPKTELYLDSLRVVRDNPPKLGDGCGGCYAFGRAGDSSWPGFDVVDAAALRVGGRGWRWEGLRPPQTNTLSWPDLLMREMVSGGSLSEREMAFSVSLSLRPGQYEGVVLAAPIMQHGLKRAEFGLRCNGQELIARHWAPERMLSDDGIFAGRDLRDFGADSVRRLWVDQTFHVLPFKADAQGGVIRFESVGTSLCGAVVYPRSNRKVFQAYLDALQARRKRYFAQQVYACVHPMLPGPFDKPADDEQRAGMQFVSVNPLLLPSPGFGLGPERLVRGSIDLFGLTGQTVTTAVGVLGLEDVRGLEVDGKRSRTREGHGHVLEIREFPVTWQHQTGLRQAVPFWLSPTRPRSLKRGRLAWYLLAVDIPRSARSRELRVGLQVTAEKRPTRTIDVRVALAASRRGGAEVCRGVSYPLESESGYLLNLVGPVPSSNMGALVLDDYRVLRDYGLNATVIHGIYLGGSDAQPQVLAQRALARARTAARAGLCDAAPGWIDFGSIANSHRWLDGSDDRVTAVVSEAFRQLHSDLGRTGVRATALVSSELSAGGRPNQAQPEELLALTRLLRQTGWRSVGVFFGAQDLHRQDGADLAGRAANTVKLAGEFDRVVAPSAMVDDLRKRWPKLAVELADPSAGRFSSGFRLWLGRLDGVWVRHVHRQTIPYLPLDSMLPDERPLLMPYPGSPRPTLRLLAIREGINDLEHIETLANLIKRRRSSREDAVEKANGALGRIHDELTDAWQKAMQDARQDPGDGRGDDLTHRRPAPAQEVMDACRRKVFDLIVGLSSPK